jgi:hypothetical protein
MMKTEERTINFKGVDISVKWRKAGWVPPSEQVEYQQKWKFIRESSPKQEKLERLK